MNSRQAQDLGSMRTLVDKLAANPQPASRPAPVEEIEEAGVELEGFNWVDLMEVLENDKH